MISDLRRSLVDSSGGGGGSSSSQVNFAHFHFERIHASFDFCIREYRPECFWYEPVDMLRKLSLTGLLQFVNRGSSEQVLVGCVISFLAFGLTMKVQPYREAEANVLKALVDFQIFLAFLCSFVLRVLAAVDNFDSLGKAFYGTVLVTGFVMVLVAAVLLLFHQVHRRRDPLRTSIVRSLSFSDFAESDTSIEDSVQ